MLQVDNVGLVTDPPILAEQLRDKDLEFVPDPRAASLLPLLPSIYALSSSRSN